MKARALLACYRKTANITLAAKKAGILPRQHYRWMKRFPKYAEAFARSQEVAAGYLESVVVKGCTEGWTEPIFYQGRLVGRVRKFDLSGRQFLLQGAMPEKYGSRVKLSGKVDTGMHKFAGTMDELLAIYRQLTAHPAEAAHD